jgi:5,10-methylenetetrahydromethanopterin reductase
VRGLLRGQQVEWEGAPIQMMHPEGFGAPRPIDVPFVIAAAGPKGIQLAKEVGQGIFGSVPMPGFTRSVLLAMGTVLFPGESPGSSRVIAAAGHAAAVGFHWAAEFDQLDSLPGGRDWAAAYAQLPERARHLALHDHHLIAVSERDRAFVTGEMLVAQRLAQSPDAWRERLAQYERSGVTEIAYQPAGPDIPGELERFAALVR